MTPLSADILQILRLMDFIGISNRDQDELVNTFVSDSERIYLLTQLNGISNVLTISENEVKRNEIRDVLIEELMNTSKKIKK